MPPSPGAPRTPLEQRNETRTTRAFPVELHFPSAAVSGPAVDASARGVYLVIDAPIAVRVRLLVGGCWHERQARLVRVETPARKLTGVALEFDEAVPELTV